MTKTRKILKRSEQQMLSRDHKCDLITEKIIEVKIKTDGAAGELW